MGSQFNFLTIIFNAKKIMCHLSLPVDVVAVKVVALR